MVVWMWLMCTWIIRAPWWPGWLLSWDRHWEHCHNSESPLTTPPRLVIPAEKERMFILLHTLWTHGHEFTRNSWITLRFGDKFIIALLLRVWYCFYLCKANMTVSFNGRSGHRHKLNVNKKHCSEVQEVQSELSSLNIMETNLLLWKCCTCFQKVHCTLLLLMCLIKNQKKKNYKNYNKYIWTENGIFLSKDLILIGPSDRRINWDRKCTLPLQFRDPSVVILVAVIHVKVGA